VYKSLCQIVGDAGEIPTGISFSPEYYDLPLDEIERLIRIGSIVQIDPDPVDAEECAVKSGDRTKSSRKRGK
jgi:hypothetical protein